MAPEPGTLKAWLEPPFSFLLTDVLAALPDMFLYRVVKSDDVVSIQPTSDSSRVITAILAVGYGIMSYLLADNAARTASEDEKYLSIGASVALFLNSIREAIVTALMGATLPAKHPATKLIR